MLWTRLHAITILPALVVFIALGVLLAKLLKGKSDKIRYIPFQVIAAALLVLEAMKQYSSIRTGDYDLYFLPFHFCSLFLFVLPLHSFYKGKGKRVIDTITFACCSSMTFFMLVMPSIIYSDGAIATMSSEFISFHTVVFHNLVCLYFILAVAMRMFEFNPKSDIKVILIFMCSFQTVCAIIANSMKVNYHNLLRCNLAPVETIRQSLVDSLGWGGQLIYIVVLSAVTVAFICMTYYLTRLILKGIDKLKKPCTAIG